MEKETLDGEDQLGAWAWVALPRDTLAGPWGLPGGAHPLRQGQSPDPARPTLFMSETSLPFVSSSQPPSQVLESALNFLFSTVLHGMQDLSSLTPCTGSMEC